MKTKDRLVVAVSRRALAASCGSFARTNGETCCDEPAASALPLTGQKLVRCIWLGLFVFICGCQQTSVDKPPEGSKSVAEAEQTQESEFKKTESLFDGQSLDNWELTEFGGEGDVWVEEGCIMMDAGDPITAINLPESFDLPTMNYEIAYEAMKVEGTDFFGTITFPVGESFCSMVIGGWAGTVVGLSSIDGVDASENETRSVRKFERNQWYRLRVRVTPEAIQGWIDDDQVINQSIVGKKIDIRSEMIPCQPLGIANFYTIAKLRNIQLRLLASP